MRFWFFFACVFFWGNDIVVGERERGSGRKIRRFTDVECNVGDSTPLGKTHRERRKEMMIRML